MFSARSKVKVSARFSSSSGAGGARKKVSLGPVVQRLDNAIHRINYYPADSVVCFVNTYPLDSVIQPSYNRGQVFSARSKVKVKVSARASSPRSRSARARQAQGQGQRARQAQGQGQRARQAQARVSQRSTGGQNTHTQKNNHQQMVRLTHEGYSTKCDGA